LEKFSHDKSGEKSDLPEMKFDFIAKQIQMPKIVDLEVEP